MHTGKDVWLFIIIHFTNTNNAIQRNILTSVDFFLGFELIYTSLVHGYGEHKIERRYLQPTKFIFIPWY